MDKHNVRIGLFAIGLDTYWDQFPDLKTNLLRYHSSIDKRLRQMQVDVVDAGLIDTVEKANEAAERFKSEGVEMIFLFVSTYALSSTVLPVVQKASVPIVVLNLQPVPQLDYEKFNAIGDRGVMTGVWLEHCQACSVPEIACVFNRAGIDYHLVTGYLEQESAWEEILCWVNAMKAVVGMRKNRLGVLGHYYGGMLDVYSDMTQLSSVFGTHFEILEMCELNELRQSVTDSEAELKIEAFGVSFDVSDECDQIELDRAARTSVALDRLVDRHRIGSMAYYYEGAPGNSYENIVTSVIAGNTLLTGRNVPVAGECEIKNAHAMKIMDLLGAGGSFSEFYLTDFIDDIVFLGHDGPAHFAIAEGRVKLVPLPVYHGKPGKGLSIQMTVQHGPATLLAVVQRGDGSIALLIAEGESVPGATLQIGNTNSRYKFPISATEFLDSWSKVGPSHHCAIGIGHLAGTIEKVAKLLQIGYERIC